MKLLTILLIIITYNQAKTQTYGGFHLAPTYTIVNTKNDTIKSFDNINSFKLGLNLEIFPADHFSLSIDPMVNFVKIRYYKATTINESSTTLELPIFMKYYMGDRTKFVGELGLAVFGTLGENIDHQSFSPKDLLKKHNGANLLTGIGISTTGKKNAKYSVILRRSTSAFKSSLNLEEYSLNFIINYKMKPKKYKETNP